MKSGWLMIPCQHANQLISARMDTPLGRMDRLRLWIHLQACDMCKRVDQQMDFMRDAVRRLGR